MHMKEKKKENKIKKEIQFKELKNVRMKEKH